MAVEIILLKTVFNHISRKKNSLPSVCGTSRFLTWARKQPRKFTIRLSNRGQISNWLKDLNSKKLTWFKQSYIISLEVVLVMSISIISINQQCVKFYSARVITNETSCFHFPQIPQFFPSKFNGSWRSFEHYFVCSR